MKTTDMRPMTDGQRGKLTALAIEAGKLRREAEQIGIDVSKMRAVSSADDVLAWAKRTGGMSRGPTIAEASEAIDIVEAKLQERRDKIDLAKTGTPTWEMARAEIERAVREMMPERAAALLAALDARTTRT